MRAFLRSIARAAAWSLVGILVAAREARAEPSAAELQQARELFTQAERDERAGEWGAALEKLLRIDGIKTTPGIRFHIALCEENLGHLAVALEDYALAEKKSIDERNQEVLAALKEPVARLRARVPRLVVRVPPDVRGVEVVVDGKPLPFAYFGAEVPVDPGAHSIVATAPGRRSFTATPRPSEGEIVTVSVTLEDATAAGSPGEAPVIARPSASAQAGTSKSPRALALGATFGALGLAGAGVISFVVAGAKQSDARSECASRTTGCDDLRGPVRAWDLVALGAWIGAGALSTVAVFLWLAPGAGSAASARLVLGPGDASLMGTFW
jgi:hypothetical protein